MKTKTGVIAALGLALAGLAATTVIQYPEARLTLRVVDEDGKPVEGADARVGFEVYTKTGALGMDGFAVKGKTDAEGKFTGTARATANVSFGVGKPGYYWHEQLYQFTSSVVINSMLQAG